MESLGRQSRLLIGASLLVACGGGARPVPGPGSGALPGGMAIERFRVDEGARDNWLVRQDGVAAHLVVTREPGPRLVVAFPAGNEGVGVWFEAGAPRALEVEEPPEPVVDGDQRGIRCLLRSDGEVNPATVVLGSVRAIRDLAEGSGLAERERVLGPERLWPRRTQQGATTSWVLDHPDGRHRSVMVLRRLAAGLVELRATTNWEPLTPIPRDQILNGLGIQLVERATGAERRALEASLDALAYLAYDEKLLAGSWRFATYFGRDTLMSLRLLAPVLSARVLAAGLRSVLDRVDRQGQVAHEEDIGGQALYRHIAAGDPRERWADGVLDYRMVDDDFLLPLLAAEAPQELRAGSWRASLDSNRAFVLSRASQSWVDLLEGEPAGDWRDSSEGLGGGRASYGVNAALVPAALAALGDVPAPLLERWRAARGAFLVRRTPDQLRGAVARYLESLPAGDRDALRGQALPGGGTVGELADGGPLPSLLDQGLVFNGVALDADRRPIPVMNSDDGFLLLDLDLPPSEVEQLLVKYQLPFPVGLRTPAGVVVASAVYSDRSSDLETFDRTRYHGAVIWSWQQALLLVGLARTLERLEARSSTDAEARRVAGLVRGTLVDLRDLDASLGELRGAELWTWGARDGRIVPVAFGAEGHATESNAVQLWSTVRLGVTAELDRVLGR